MAMIPCINNGMSEPFISLHSCNSEKFQVRVLQFWELVQSSDFYRCRNVVCHYVIPTAVLYWCTIIVG